MRIDRETDKQRDIQIEDERRAKKKLSQNPESKCQLRVLYSLYGGKSRVRLPLSQYSLALLSILRFVHLFVAHSMCKIPQAFHMDHQGWN